MMVPMFPLTAFPHQVHMLSETAAISAGAFYYRRIIKKMGNVAQGLLASENFPVLIGCIFGAALGNKLVFWLQVPNLFPLFWDKPELWLNGQSMVGGLLGGLIGVELAKKLTGVQRSTGDAFVFPILLGLIIGRMGCFVAGLDDGTYGIPTTMPWGVNFGDGIPRHPTQLYEIAFAAVLWWVLSRGQLALAPQSGLLFKFMLGAYLIWRLVIDFLKPVPYDFGFGLSGIQVVCVMVLLVYLPSTVKQWNKLRKSA